MTERPELVKCTVRANAGKVDGGSRSRARAEKAPVFLDNKLSNISGDDSIYQAG